MWSLLAKATGSGASFSSSFASTAAAFNRLRDAGDADAANDLLERAKSGQFFEELAKGLHILTRALSLEDVRASRASAEALAAAVEGRGDENYGPLLCRAELGSRAELLALLVEALRRPDLWLRFWTLRALLALASGPQLPQLRAALLGANEGARLLADTVKDPREQIQLLGASLLGLAARECLPIAQLACYAGAFEDLFSVAESGGGAEGSAASGALEAAEALLEGAATNRAHFVANNGDKNVLASRLCALLSVDSSDELVLTDAKAASLAAACRVVLALRESGPALSSLLCPVLSRLALGRVPAQKVRALALWALASALPPRLVEGGFVLDEARAVRVALRASPLEASAAAALLAAWWSRVPQGAALALPESPVSLLARAAWGAHNATAEESATSCWFACLALCGVARAGEAILSAAHALLAGVSARDPMMALGRLRLALRFVSDNAQFAGALLRAGALGPLVEALLGPSSSPHVAAAAGALLRSLAGHDRPACDVLLRRVGPDKFLAPFRAVLRSKEWQEGLDLSDEWLWSKETILLYGPAWRNALREEMDGARAGWPSLTGATAPVVVSSSESTLRAQLARANEDLAAARVQIQQQQEQIAHLQKEQQQQQQPAGMELEMLTSRDNQIAALKKELAEVHKENTRLLELLADQEIALMK